MRIQIHDIEWKKQRYKELAHKRKLTRKEWHEITVLEKALDRHCVEYASDKEMVRLKRLIRVSRTMM